MPKNEEPLIIRVNGQRLFFQAVFPGLAHTGVPAPLMR